MSWPGINSRTVCLTCALACLLYGSVVSATPPSASGEPTFFRGINLSGAELNVERNPGVYGKDFVYPSSQELDYYASKGFAVVRLPYRWSGCSLRCSASLTRPSSTASKAS